MAYPVQVLTGMLLFVLTVGTFAQDDSIDERTEDEFIEEVIVTGTRIARRDLNTPSPLTTISETDIIFTVQPTIEETLNQMPQVFPGFGRASNNPGTGVAVVDLRGFGPDRTLVLFNNRRVAPSGTGSSVDLNNIPRFLLDRIEVITGGTSTVYGSDAIAGVVNFMTRTDYDGFGVEAGYNIAEEGDTEAYDVSMAYGHNFSNGRGNIAFYAHFLERKSLLADAREFTRYAWVDDWEGDLYQGGSSRIPGGVVMWPEADLGDGPVPVMFNPDGTPREFSWYTDLYNYAPVNYLQVPLKRYAVGALGHYDFSDHVEGYFEASFNRNDSATNLASVPAQLYVEVNLDNPVLVPETRQMFAEFYAGDGCPPNRGCLNFRRRMLEVGPRYHTSQRDYSRLVTGVKGDFGTDWEFDAWITYTTASEVSLLHNDVSKSRFQQGLLVDPVTNQCYDPSGNCVPLNLFGEDNLSPEGAAFIRHQPYENVTERDHMLGSAYVSGLLFDTWAGPVGVAFGLDWRSNDTYYKSDEALFNDDAMGWNGSAPVDGTESVFEFYGEALVPLLSDKSWAESLELEIGARYSKYERAAGFWTYKAGFSWRVFNSLQLRAMHQRSERAPNSLELFEEQFKSEWVLYGSEVDPCSASADPVGNGNVEKCLIQGLPEDQVGVFENTPWYPVDFWTGGNPELESEVGDTWTAGAVISPVSLPGLTFTVDYFRLEVTDTIGGILADVICFDPANTANVFCENLKRDASGNIYEVWELTSNRGLMKTSGVDTQLQYQTDLPDWLAFRDDYAKLNVNFYWTHIISWESQENPVTEILKCAGLFGWPCDYIAFPENRTTTSFNFSSGPVEARLTWRWIDGTKNAAPLMSEIYGYPDPDLAVPTVSNRHYLDLGIAYNFSEHYQLQFGVNNLLNTNPPMMADQSWSNNTDEGLYDVFGRSYRLQMSAQF